MGFPAAMYILSFGFRFIPYPIEFLVAEITDPVEKGSGDQTERGMTKQTSDDL